MKKFKFLIICFFIIICFGGILYLIILRLSNDRNIITIFSVQVNTERIEFVKNLDNEMDFVIKDGEINDYNHRLYNKFNGTFNIQTGSKIIIERVTSGPIKIQIENSKNEGCGQLFQVGKSDKQMPFSGNFIEIVMSDIQSHLVMGESYNFPIRGPVNLGRLNNSDIPGESTALLRDGTITLLGIDTLLNYKFEAGERKLYLGDRFECNGNAFGFVNVNEKPGMQVAYRIIAKDGHIFKPGIISDNNNYQIRASYFDEIKSIQGIPILALVVGVIGGLQLLLLFVFEFYNFCKEN